MLVLTGIIIIPVIAGLIWLNQRPRHSEETSDDEGYPVECWWHEHGITKPEPGRRK